MRNCMYVNVKYFRCKIILIGLPQMAYRQLEVIHEVHQFPTL